MKNESRSPFAALKASPAISFAVLLLIALFAAITASYFIVQKDAANDQRYLRQTADLRAEAYRLTALSRDATSGDEEAFAELNGVVSTMSRTWESLRASDDRTRQQLRQELAAYAGIWSRVKGNAEIISTNKDQIVNLKSVGKALNEYLPNVQIPHYTIGEFLLESDAPADQASQPPIQAWGAERTGANIDKMLRDASDATTAADQFELHDHVCGRVLT